MLAMIQFVIVICIIAAPINIAYAATGPKGDYLLANQLALDIYENQHSLTHHEIILKLNEIKDAIRVSLYEWIPTNLPANINSELLMNVFCLGRLIDVSSRKCYQVDKKIFRQNVQRANYLDLYRISMLYFNSDNMKSLIKQHADAQFYICKQSLIIHMIDTWSRLQEWYKPYAATFKDMILSEIPPELSISELRGQTIITAITKIVIKLYAVEFNEEMIVRAYNISFMPDCATYFLDPFNTLMMTYESLNRNRIHMDKHRELIWIYDLCSHLPISIGNLNDIGNLQKRFKPIYMPAVSKPRFRNVGKTVRT